MFRQLGGKLGNSQELIKIERKKKKTAYRCGNNSVKGQGEGQAEVFDFDLYMPLLSWPTRGRDWQALKDLFDF